MSRLRAALVLPLALAAALSAQTDVPRFATGTLDEVRERAIAGGFGLVIDFSNDACEPCRRLLATTWSDADLWKWVDANALALRVDPEQDPAAAAPFELVAYPTIVAFDKQGKEVLRLVGYRDANSLRAELSRALIRAPTDHRERFALADRLRQGGDDAAALDHYVWLWDHGEEHNRGFSGVRASFFLRRFAQFGRRYPPALAALEERRDALERRVLAGETDYDVVSDMVAINRELGTRERSLQVLERVPEEQWAGERVARGAIVRSVTELLVETRRYEEAARWVGDALAEFERELVSPAMGMLPDNLRKEMAIHKIAQMRVPLEAWFGVDDERAGKLVDRLVELKPDRDTWTIVLRAAKRAGNDVALHDYAIRALDELPESDHERIRGFLKRR